MRIVDENGLVPTGPPSNPSITVRDIDLTPSVTGVHTLQTSSNVVTDLALGRARISNPLATGASPASKLIFSGRFN